MSMQHRALVEPRTPVMYVEPFIYRVRGIHPFPQTETQGKDEGVRKARLEALRSRAGADQKGVSAYAVVTLVVIVITFLAMIAYYIWMLSCTRKWEPCAIPTQMISTFKGVISFTCSI